METYEPSARPFQLQVSHTKTCPWLMYNTSTRTTVGTLGGITYLGLG